MNDTMLKEDLLKIIIEINSNENYFGIIPIYPVYTKAKYNFQVSLEQFHELLFQLEKDKIIYLEVINDINRLSIEEKNTSLYDQFRGYLYYIGLWK